MNQLKSMNYKYIYIRSYDLHRISYKQRKTATFIKVQYQQIPSSFIFIQLHISVEIILWKDNQIKIPPSSLIPGILYVVCLNFFIRQYLYNGIWWLLDNFKFQLTHLFCFSEILFSLFIVIQWIYMYMIIYNNISLIT